MVGGGFAAMGVAPQLLAGGHYHFWPLMISVVLGLAAVAYPAALQPVYARWMAAGRVMGAFNRRIILTLVYYLIFTPLGLICKLSGRKLLHLEFDENATTYRINRNRREASHLHRHF